MSKNFHSVSHIEKKQNDNKYILYQYWYFLVLPDYFSLNVSQLMCCNILFIVNTALSTPNVLFSFFVGKNVEIKGSYLWSNVTVGDNCKLDTCLLAENVILHSNVTIQPGCILGNEVRYIYLNRVSVKLILADCD